MRYSSNHVSDILMFCYCVKLGTTPSPCPFVVCVPTTSPLLSELDHALIKPRHHSASTTTASRLLLSLVSEWQLSPSALDRRHSNALRHVSLRVRHPASSPFFTALIQQCFFNKFADVLDRLSTYTEPVVLTGDVNIRLERSSDLFADQFRELLDSYGLVQHVHDIFHLLEHT